MQTQTIQKTKELQVTLEEFEKMHSKPFLYILEQYEKWQKLKEQAGMQTRLQD